MVFKVLSSLPIREVFSIFIADKYLLSAILWCLHLLYALLVGGNIL